MDVRQLQKLSGDIQPGVKLDFKEIDDTSWTENFPNWQELIWSAGIFAALYLTWKLGKKFI